MNRFLIFIILLVSAFYLRGMYLPKEYYTANEVMQEEISDWKKVLVDSVGISEPALNLSLNAYHLLLSENRLQNDSILTIIDFSKPSDKKRLFILDIRNEKILINTWVAHGMQSGLVVANSFSNSRHSNKSSLGLYITGATYMGKHGYSLRIEGLSKGLNDNAEKRAVVIHGADYVSTDFIEKHGRLGRSFGCPAVSVEESTEIIELIKNGSCLYIYHPSLIPISESNLEKLN